MKELESAEKKNHYVLAYKGNEQEDIKISSFDSTEADQSEMTSLFKSFLLEHLGIENITKNVIFGASNTETIDSIEQIVIQYKDNDSKHVTYQANNALSMYDFEKIKQLETTFDQDINGLDDICKAINGLIIKNVLPIDKSNKGPLIFVGVLDKDPGFKNDAINMVEISEAAKEPKRYLNRFATNDSFIVSLFDSTLGQNSYVIYDNNSWAMANEVLQNNSWTESVINNLSLLNNEIDTNNIIGLSRKNFNSIANQDVSSAGFNNSIVLDPVFISEFAKNSGRIFNFKLYPILADKKLSALCSYGWIRGYSPEPEEVLKKPVVSVSNESKDLDIFEVINKNEKPLQEYPKAKFLLLNALLSYLFENNAARGIKFILNDNESILSALGEPCLISSQSDFTNHKVIFRAIDLGQPIAYLHIPKKIDGEECLYEAIDGSDITISEILLTTIKSERGRSLGDDTYAVVFIQDETNSLIGYKVNQAVLFKDKSEAVDMFIGSLKKVVSSVNQDISMFSLGDKNTYKNLDIRKTAKKVVSLFELEDKATLSYESMQKLFTPTKIEPSQLSNS